MQEMFTFKHRNYIPDLSSSLSDIIKEKGSSDVRLVSDDQIQYQAHKHVLSVSSPVLKQILLSNPHPHPLIYLSGIKHEELESILDFIYLGETSCSNSNMNRFIHAATDLQLNQITKSIKEEICFNQEKLSD